MKRFKCFLGHQPNYLNTEILVYQYRASVDLVIKCVDQNYDKAKSQQLKAKGYCMQESDKYYGLPA